MVLGIEGDRIGARGGPRAKVGKETLGPGEPRRAQGGCGGHHQSVALGAKRIAHFARRPAPRAHSLSGQTLVRRRERGGREGARARASWDA